MEIAGKKIAIFGAEGQLGNEFCKRLFHMQVELFAFTYNSLDITEIYKMRETILSIHPDIIINCAAYNAVDAAENEPAVAYKVNSFAPFAMAKIAKEIDSLLIHYSTDYIFDGEKGFPYTEEDEPNPINEYGKSKYLGEVFVREEHQRHLILRTSWLYGIGKQNFIYKLVKWAEERKHLDIVDDEISVPSSTRMVVDVTFKAIERDLLGMYHLVNTGHASRYEWAKYVNERWGLGAEIRPVPSTQFTLPARRPRFTVLDNSRIINTLGITIPNWKDELDIFLSQVDKTAL